MHAMLHCTAGHPLIWTSNWTVPRPQAGEVLIHVHACGVCRTDLHIVDGDLTDPKVPLIPGHEVVGTIVERGAGVKDFKVGDRIGVPWLGWTCGECQECQNGRENLCPNARFTGYQLNGGYAEYMTADARFCFAIPPIFSDQEAAPLLCAGMIGYRALRMAGLARKIGFYGFGAAAHIAAQVARHRGQEVYAFTTPGDTEAQNFALGLGAVWAGGSDATPPLRLDAAIIYAPVGALLPAALQAIAPGGTVVTAGIHMSDIPSFPYKWLWGERMIRSVANLTRQDGEEFLRLAAEIPIRTTTVPIPLADANTALARLRAGLIEGAIVLVP